MQTMRRFAKITGTATEKFTGMIYVMSDIHGSRRRFDAVMEQIKLTDEDTLYILGDVTHRDIKKLSEAERESLFDWIDALPTELDITVNGRRYKLVHAMPKELFYLAKRPQLGEKYFSVWDRQSGEAPLSGEYTMIFGHTTSHHYQDGSPMRIWHGPDRMDIDCGSAYPDVQDKNAEFIGRLACIRLDDMREFYSGESIY